MFTIAVSSTTISWATAMTARASPSDWGGIDSPPPLRGRVGVGGTSVAIINSSLRKFPPPLAGEGRVGVWPQLEDRVALRLVNKVGHRRIGAQGVKAAKERRLQRRLEARPEHLLQNRSSGVRGQLDGGNRLPVSPSTEDPLPCRAQVTGPVGLAERRQQPAVPVVLEQPDRGGPRLTAGSAAHGKQGHRAYRHADSEQTKDQRVEDRDIPRNVRGLGHFSAPPSGRMFGGHNIPQIV